MAADPDAVAEAFVRHYYNQFDTNRAQLGALYQPTSMLTFEGEKFQGPEAIVGKLSTFPSVQHNVVKCDAQPSPGDGVLVSVTGDLIVNGGPNTMKFAQVFNLLPSAGGSYFVLNDMFRLNIS